MDFTPEDSPELIKLMHVAEEIREVLRRHDVAGIAIIQTNEPRPGLLQYVAELGPSFSCVEMKGTALVQRELPPPKVVHLDPRLGRADTTKVHDTLNMLANIRAKATQLSGLLLQAEMAVRVYHKMPMPQPLNIRLNGRGGDNGKA